MGIELCRESSAADWLKKQGLSWWRLAVRGPVGYPKYARVRFIPDPDFPGQKANDVEFDQKELSEKEQVGVALDVLSRYTTTPNECYFCMWTGWDTAIPVAPNFVFSNRDYWLFRGTLTDYADWNDSDPVRWPYGYSPDPAFIWPADRAWCVTNDVDPHFATIGADIEAIDQIVADPRIDAVLDDPEQEPPYWG
ncbi:hypothetical protein [Rhodococcus opacus]|uniref:DUF2716 domain-containing protein n=1 Tax=Rhodococcus opacus (strain B4) TaxID=632772 RepID=C1B819_RHOOB|nr:hypothetical protein [Rhodococcus opacus]BAH51822.1 hypothetical protein ROP_35750 [Rhodococcus opacus B4]